MQAAGVLEQIPQGDAASVVPVSPDQPGKPPVDAVPQRQPTLGDELQDGGGDEGLGRAARPEGSALRHTLLATRFPRARAPSQHALPVPDPYGHADEAATPQSVLRTLLESPPRERLRGDVRTGRGRGRRHPTPQERDGAHRVEQATPVQEDGHRLHCPKNGARGTARHHGNAPPAAPRCRAPCPLTIPREPHDRSPLRALARPVPHPAESTSRCEAKRAPSATESPVDNRRLPLPSPSRHAARRRLNTLRIRPVRDYRAGRHRAYCSFVWARETRRLRARVALGPRGPRRFPHRPPAPPPSSA